VVCAASRRRRAARPRTSAGPSTAAHAMCSERDRIPSPGFACAHTSGSVGVRLRHSFGCSNGGDQPKYASDGSSPFTPAHGHGRRRRRSPSPPGRPPSPCTRPAGSGRADKGREKRPVHRLRDRHRLVEDDHGQRRSLGRRPSSASGSEDAGRPSEVDALLAVGAFQRLDAALKVRAGLEDLRQHPLERLKRRRELVRGMDHEPLAEQEQAGEPRLEQPPLPFWRGTSMPTSNAAHLPSGRSPSAL
jgi:hypothetical protein